ncbi:MAG: hypothetical protein KBS86_03375 [Proteobacteria bacterium]|nr:hypothetical protein [Candidatus Enterousia scatequi]
MSQIITLNGNIIKAIRPNINFSSHEKRKDDRERLRFSHCLFLTQDSNGLNYQIATPHKIVRVIDPIKTKIPYPLAINLEPVSHFEMSETINLEIPDCTFATLQAHNDTNRPKYIKTSDLQTNVVKLGDNKTNLEYLNVAKITQRLNDLIYFEIDFTHKDEAFKYQWDTDSLHELADLLQPDYAHWHPFMHTLSENEEHKQNTANKILKQISKFGHIYKTDIDENYNERILEQPIAIFEKMQNNKHVTALLVSKKQNIK